MYSALMNKDDDDYIEFYFIVDKTFSRQKTIPEFEILNTQGSSVNYIEAIPAEYELYRETTQRTELPINAYYRLGLPWLLPYEERAIYLDYDTLVLKSLWEIYNIDLTDYYLAAVEDAWKYKRARELAKYQRNMRHYNTGMMVLNLPKWRKGKISDKLRDFSKRYKHVFILADQFLANTIINQNVIYLDFKWNLQIPRFERGEPIEYDDLVAFEKAQKDPRIIHYNFAKPWQFTKCLNPFFDLWWYYARQLPFYEKVLIEGIRQSL